MKRIALLVTFIVVVALLAGCAPAANPSAGVGDDPAGFWAGLWHGAIMLVTFVISLFNPNVGIYEVNNSGNWYNFGYLLGALMFLGGGSGGAAAGSRGRR